MGLKFYLHRGTTADTGTLPATNASVSATAPTWTPGVTNGTATTPLLTNRAWDITIGASAQTSQAYSTAANTTAQAQPLLRFVSAPLAAQTIAAQTVGITLGFSCSNTASNFSFACSLALWRPSTGALVSRLYDTLTTVSSAATATEASYTLNINTTAGTAQANDILVLEIWRAAGVQSMATSYTNTLFYDGQTENSATNNAAFILFQNNVQLASDVLLTPSAPVTAQGTATASLTVVSPPLPAFNQTGILGTPYTKPGKIALGAPLLVAHLVQITGSVVAQATVGGTGGTPSWSYVAGSYADDGSGFGSTVNNQVVTLTLGASVPVGGRIIFAIQLMQQVSGSGMPSLSSVVDNLNTGQYHQDSTQTLTNYQNGTNQPVRQDVYSKVATVAGIPTISATISLPSGNGFGGMLGAAYTGLLTTDPSTDVIAQGTGVSTTASAGPTSATGAAGELVICAVTDSGEGCTLAPGSGFTSRGLHQNDGAWWQGIFEDASAGASGSTVTGTATKGASTPYFAATLVYKFAPVSGGGQVGLTIFLPGTPVGQATVSGALNLSLTGAIVGQGSATSTLGVPLALPASAITAQAVVTAGLTVKVPGAIVAQATVTATQLLTLLQASTVTAQAVVTGALTVGLAGAVVGQATVAGTIGTGVNLAGAIAAQASVVGALTLNLVGSVVAQAVATSTTAISLTGAIKAQAVVTAGLTVAIPGVTVGQATVSGTISTAIPITGAVTAQASATAATQIALAGAVVAQAAVAGTATTSAGLAGAITAQATATSALSISLVGASVAQASTSGTLANNVFLTGAVAAQALVAAAPQIFLTGAVSAQATTTGLVGAPGLLLGNVTAQASITGALSIVIVGTVTAQGSASNTLFVLVPVAGTVTAQASATTALSINLQSVVVAQAAVAGALLGSTGLTGSVVAQGTITGALTVSFGVSAVAQASVVGALWINLAGGPNVYSTTFPLTENPISEGGMWIDGGVVGLDWTNPRTTTNEAFGTQTGNEYAASGIYNDSIACLKGSWSSDQQAQATVFNNSTQGAPWYAEVEILLRFSIAAHSGIGYETNFSCNNANGYCTIVRWDSALGSFTTLNTTFPGAVKTGDVIKVTIVGNVITAYVNGTQVNQFTDSTPIYQGAPGIGFYLANNSVGGGGDPTTFGLTQYSASGTGIAPATTGGQGTSTSALSTTSGIPLSANITAQAVATAALSVALTSAVVAQSVVVGSLGNQVPVTGAIVAQATSTALLTVLLAGSSAGQASVAGTLAGQLPLAGAIAAQASSVAGLTVAMPGAVVAQGSISGTLIQVLTGAIVGQGSATGTIASSVALTGAVQGQASTQTSVAVALAGAVTAQAAVSGATGNNQVLVGAIVGQGSVSAALIITVALVGSTTGQATTIIGLTVGLVGVVKGQASVAGTFFIPAPMSVAILAQGSATATLITFIILGSGTCTVDEELITCYYTSEALTTDYGVDEEFNTYFWCSEELMPDLTPDEELETEYALC